MRYTGVLFVGLLVFLMSTSVNAQSSSFDWKKVKYGGRLNLDFSNSNTSVIVAPSARYQLNEKFSLGGSVSFGYTSFKSSDTKQYNYGASILSFYNPFRELQLSAELEQTFVNQTGDFKNNFDFLALNIGAGYRLGNNIVAGVRYDVLYNKDKSLYTSPFSPFVQVSF